MAARFKASCSTGIFKQVEKCQLKNTTWKITPQGLTYQAHPRFDKFGTPVMAELYLSPKEFKSFECREEFMMGINSRHFKRALKCTDWLDTIVFSVDEDVSYFEFVIYNQRGECKKSQTFKLKCTPVELLKPFVKKESHHVSELKMSSERFKDIVNAMRKISELRNDIKICMSKDKVIFESVGDNWCHSSTVTITPKGENCTYNVPPTTTVEAAFRNVQLDYPIHNMYTNENILLKFTEQKELVAEYRILKCGYMRYYLASQLTIKQEHHKLSKRKGIPVKNECKVKKERFYE